MLESKIVSNTESQVVEGNMDEYNKITRRAGGTEMTETM